MIATDTTETFSVVFAGLAFVIATLAYWQSRRSANASERSADAAEASSGHAARSAAAAERGADAQEESVGIGRRKEIAAQREDSEKRAPRWEAVREGPEGEFSYQSGVFEGRLRNAGALDGRIEEAFLNLPTGGRLPLTGRREPVSSGSAGWESHPNIPPNLVLALQAEVAAADFAPDGRPTIYLQTKVLGQPHLDAVGASILLLRTGTGPDGSQRWRVDRIVPGVLA